MPSVSGRTESQMTQRKRLFLEHFGEYGIVSHAAEHAGIERRTVYRWQEDDDDFANAYRQAEMRATEVLEVEARRRAVEGVVTESPIYSRTGQLLNTIIETKYSDTLLIFLLKARAPDKYRERFDVRSTATVQVVGYESADLDLIK